MLRVCEIQATPIVDTIQEHEKYGNDGDRFGFGRKIVDSYEALANIINKLIDVSCHRSLCKRYSIEY